MNNPLQNKLLHYEALPPEGVWDKITASLNENLSPALSEKLYQYQEEPSPEIWQNISSKLNASDRKEAKLVPFYVRYRKPLKYSGAIAVFVFLAMITSLLISKKTESEVPVDRVVNTHTSVKKDSAKNNGAKENNSVSQVIEKNTSEQLIAKTKTVKAAAEENENSVSFTEDLLPQKATRTTVVSSSFNSDKYMIYSDGDGNAVRLPKKIFSAFACPSNNADCKQRLQMLREKFAESAMTTDFTGILQILKNLQENQ